MLQLSFDFDCSHVRLTAYQYVTLAPRRWAVGCTGRVEIARRSAREGVEILGYDDIDCLQGQPSVPKKDGPEGLTPVEHSHSAVKGDALHKSTA